MTLIEWSTNPVSTSTTTNVPIDGLLRGIGSKQIKLNYTGNSNAIAVTPNVRWTWDPQTQTGTPNSWDKVAMIENLIIDGQGSTNATGILLQDVYNCTVRNVTIKNFNVGIKLTATDYYNILGDGSVSSNEAVRNFSEANRIKHVRLENVKTGILIDSGTGTGSFAFTTIDDIGIQLKNDSSAVGIQLGASGLTAQPYSSFIKANVWVQSAGGTGMKLNNAELKYGLLNLGVQGSGTGKGVDIEYSGGDYRVYDNQFDSFDGQGNPLNGFLLSGGGLSTYVYNPNSYHHDILVRSY